MNQAFSVDHVKSGKLTRHPKGQEAVDHASVTFRRKQKLEIKTSELSAYHWHLF